MSYFEPGDIVRYIGPSDSMAWSGLCGRVQGPYLRPYNIDTRPCTTAYSVYWYSHHCIYWAFTDELELATEEDAALAILAEIGGQYL
jgi:hypothetical protein